MQNLTTMELNKRIDISNLVITIVAAILLISIAIICHNSLSIEHSISISKPMQWSSDTVSWKVGWK